MGIGIASLVFKAIDLQQNQKARRATRKSNELQQRIADVKAQRERVKLVSEARRKQAALAQQAKLSGVSGSSSAIAGQQQLTQQAASGVSFLDQVQQLGQQSNIFTQRAADAQGTANLFSAGAKIATGFSKLKETPTSISPGGVDTTSLYTPINYGLTD